MELAVRAFIVTVFAAVVCILGFSMATAAITTTHLAHPVTHLATVVQRSHDIQVAQR